MGAVATHISTTGLKAEVVKLLSEREYGPIELIEKLNAYPVSDIKDAVSELLDEQRIELLRNRKLRVRVPEHNAAD